MPPPNGYKPVEIAPELANEFVNVYLPTLWKEIKDKKLKKTFTSLRETINLRRKNVGLLTPLSKSETKSNESEKSKEGNAALSENGVAPSKVDTKKDKTTKTTVTTINVPSIRIPRGAEQQAETFRKLVREDKIKDELVEHLWSAFQMINEKRSSDITAEHLGNFYERIDHHILEEDVEYVIQLLTDGGSKEKAGFEDFTKTMHRNMGRTEAFGDFYDLFVKGEKTTIQELRAMMANIGEDFDDRRLRLMLPKMLTREDFVKYWGDTLHDIVTPKPPPGLPKPAPSGDAASKTPSSSTTTTTSASDQSVPNGASETSKNEVSERDALEKNPKFKKYFNIAKRISKRAALQRAAIEGISDEDIGRIKNALGE